MATADTKKSRKKSAALPPSDGASRRPRRLRRWLWFGLPLIMFGGALGVFPTLASYTPLGKSFLTGLVPIRGTLEIGSLSLGWLSPIELQDIVLRDDTGKVVAQAATVSCDRTLVQLLLDHSDLGHCLLDQPQINLICDEQGSNLEQVLAPLLVDDGGSGGSTAIALAIKISSGQIGINDLPSQRQYQINAVTADVAWDSDSPRPLTVQASAAVVDAQRTAEIGLTLASERAGAEAGPLGAGQLKCQIDRLPLDILEPLLRRRIAGGQLAGAMTANLDCAWGAGEQHDQVSVAGQIDLTDLLFASAALGHDRLEMARLSAPCQIVGSTEQVQIERLSIDCDLGQLAVTGVVRPADFNASDTIAAIARQSYQVTGRLDLVRLAALLPETLHLRPGTQITAGALGVSLASQPPATPENSTASWSGKLETSDLEALADGQAYQWQQPLAVAFQAHDAPNGPVVDKFTCDSNFLHVEGAGTLDQLTGGASFDLSRLAAEVAQFVNLRGYQLTGTGQAQFTWQRDPSGQLQSQLDLTARDFTMAVPGRRAWREANLHLHVDGAGLWSGGGIAHVDAFKGQLDAGAEQLTLTLTAPVDKPAENPLPVNIAWQGELAAWLARAGLWFDLSGWDIGGRGTLTGQATVTINRQAAGALVVDVQQSRIDLDQLHVWGHGLYIDETQAEAMAAVHWDGAGRRLDVPVASLKGTAFVLRANQLQVVAAAGSNLQAAGNVTLQGDLTGLSGWLGDPHLPATRSVSGQLSAQLDIEMRAGVSQTTLNATIDQLQVVELRPVAVAASQATLLQPAAPPPPASWREARLSLAAKLEYDPAHDELQIAQGQLIGENLQAAAGGKISGLSSAPDFDLSGQIVCNWEQLAPFWRPYLGASAQIVGNEPCPFVLRGPWTSGSMSLLAGMQRMIGQASVKWLSAQAFGLDVSGGQLDARLESGNLLLQPNGVTISGGQLTFAPTLRLAAQPAVIEIPRGTALANVQLTPEICAQGLKFVAPILAEVTRTEGQFSIVFEGGRLPLTDPGSGDVAGQIQVQSVQLHPGPILQSLLGFAQQIEGVVAGKTPFSGTGNPVSLVRLDNQTVEFRLVDRRVYHRGLRFSAGNVTITTRGSVGLDETLAVLAEIPLDSKLLGSNPLTARANSKSLQIPIEGTLSNPHIDPKAIEQLPLLLLKGTGRIVDGVEGALEKLIPGER